jgi:hypothetical protein
VPQRVVEMLLDKTPESKTSNRVTSCKSKEKEGPYRGQVLSRLFYHVKKDVLIDSLPKIEYTSIEVSIPAR